MVDWGDVEVLLLAVGGRDEHVLAAVDGIGVERAAGVVVEEVLLRCDPAPALPEGYAIGFELSHRGEAVSHVLRSVDGRLRAEPGAAEGLCVLSFAVDDVLRLLYGPPADRPPVSRHLRVPRLGADPWSAAGEVAAVTAATTALLAAITDTRIDLDHLAGHYGSDKWGGWHWYTPHYARHFQRLRTEPVRVLEIGIGDYSDPAGGGASLRMWQRYFRRGLVHGLDIVDKTAVDGLRVRALRGDQSDPDRLAEIAALGPFDIVIDDGSHRPADVITSFSHLFPAVRPGGYYVIEDLQTSYWPAWGGSDRDLTSPATTVGFLKTLVDGLHHEQHKAEPDRTDRTITGIFFYPDIAFIEKGRNDVGGLRMGHVGLSADASQGSDQ
jgi:hypothetical protein